MFAYSIQGEKLLKVHAGKLWPSINRNGRWQASIAFHAQTKDGQAGAITGRIKGQVVSGNAPGMGEDEQSQPTLSQWLASPRIAQHQIQFRMIQMRHGPGVAPMTVDGSLGVARVILEWIGRTGSFSHKCLIIPRFVPLDFCVKHALTHWGKVLLFRKSKVLSVGSSFRLAGHGIVMCL